MITPISIALQAYTEKPEVWELRVDWTSLLSYRLMPSHATVMCYTNHHRDAVDPWASCPRRLLQNTVKSFEAEHFTSIIVGFEVEFSYWTLSPPANVVEPAWAAIPC